MRQIAIAFQSATMQLALAANNWYLGIMPTEFLRGFSYYIDHTPYCLLFCSTKSDCEMRIAEREMQRGSANVGVGGPRGAATARPKQKQKQHATHSSAPRNMYSRFMPTAMHLARRQAAQKRRVATDMMHRLPLEHVSLCAPHTCTYALYFQNQIDWKRIEENRCYGPCLRSGPVLSGPAGHFALPHLIWTATRASECHLRNICEMRTGNCTKHSTVQYSVSQWKENWMDSMRSFAHRE